MGVRNNGEEFVNAGPRYGPRGLALGQLSDAPVRGIVPWRIFSMRVDQEVTDTSSQRSGRQTST